MMTSVPGLDHRADDRRSMASPAADRDKDIFLFIVQVKAAAKELLQISLPELPSRPALAVYLVRPQLKAADAASRTLHGV